MAKPKKGLNQEVIKAAIEFRPENYLNPEDKLQYYKDCQVVRDLGNNHNQLSACFHEALVLEERARIRFAEIYKDFPEELMCAISLVSETAIVKEKRDLEDYLRVRKYKGTVKEAYDKGHALVETGSVCNTVDEDTKNTEEAVYRKFNNASMSTYIADTQAAHILAAICVLYADRLNDAYAYIDAALSRKWDIQTQDDTVSEELLNKPALYYPKNHSSPNHILSNVINNGYGSLHKPVIEAGAFDLPTLPRRGSKEEVKSYVLVDYDEDAATLDLKFENGHPSAYERTVADAVHSLCLYAHNKGLPLIFSADEIHRTMPGGGRNPSKDQMERIDHTMNKYRHLKVTANLTREFQARGLISQNDKFVIDDMYFTFKRGKAILNNKPISVYEFAWLPPILDLSMRTKNLLTVPVSHIRILDVSDGTAIPAPIRLTPGRQAIVSYMLHRILLMKGKNGVSSQIIRFDSVMNETGECNATPKTIKAHMHFCSQVLDYWKYITFIEDYIIHEVNNGRRKGYVESYEVISLKND